MEAVLKEFGSNKDVTLLWGNVLSFRITGNLQPLVEKYTKFRKAISESQSPYHEALKNAREEIIGDITLGRDIYNHR